MSGPFTLGGQIPDLLGVLEVCGVGTGGLHRADKRLRVIQQRARAQVVAVSGLPGLVGLEEGALQGLQQSPFPDVGVGVVDEGAGLTVSVGVDM